MKKEKIAIWLLRLGLAFAFVYAAISAYLNPDAWSGYIPELVKNLIPLSDKIILDAIGVVQILIASWLILSKKIFIPSLLASIYLIALLAFNWSALNILFRDITILSVALSLCLMNWPSRK